jgi:hypothetical protein
MAMQVFPPGIGLDELNQGFRGIVAVEHSVSFRYPASSGKKRRGEGSFQ